VRIVDANVLLYAVNEDADRHDDSVAWVNGALNGNEVVGFAWLAVLAFLRLSTRVGLFPRPLTIQEAGGQLRDWLTQPQATVVEPGPRHLDALFRLLSDVGTGGNLVNDAHLAALSVEHSATIVTYDNDFGRFPGVSWERPGG
jgi:uncharacterized protein